jgi:hypothetical protein
VGSKPSLWQNLPFVGGVSGNGEYKIDIHHSLIVLSVSSRFAHALTAMWWWRGRRADISTCGSRIMRRVRSTSSLEIWLYQMPTNYNSLWAFCLLRTKMLQFCLLISEWPIFDLPHATKPRSSGLWHGVVVWRRHGPSKRCSPTKSLHGVITQRITTWIFIALRISLSLVPHTDVFCILYSLSLSINDSRNLWQFS